MRLRPNPPAPGGPSRTRPALGASTPTSRTTTDPVSVAFNDAKRARAKAALRAKEGGRSATQWDSRARVDRSKYPSFKAWLTRRRRTTRGCARRCPATRTPRAREREAARGGVRGQGALRAACRTRRGAEDDEDDGAGDAGHRYRRPRPRACLGPVHRADEALRTPPRASASALSAEDQEKALMECAAEAAREPSRRRRRRRAPARRGPPRRGRSRGGGGARRRGGVRGRGVAAPSRGGSNPDESEHRAVHPRPEPARVAARALRRLGVRISERRDGARPETGRRRAPRRGKDARGAFG